MAKCPFLSVDSPTNCQEDNCQLWCVYISQEHTDGTAGECALKLTALSLAPKGGRSIIEA